LQVVPVWEVLSLLPLSVKEALEDHLHATAPPDLTPQPAPRTDVPCLTMRLDGSGDYVEVRVEADRYHGDRHLEDGLSSRGDVIPLRLCMMAAPQAFCQCCGDLTLLAVSLPCVACVP
jgi:hypothetical protein